jgi:hypothetical protein
MADSLEKSQGPTTMLHNSQKMKKVTSNRINQMGRNAMMSVPLRSNLTAECGAWLSLLPE